MPFDESKLAKYFAEGGEALGRSLLNEILVSKAAGGWWSPSIGNEDGVTIHIILKSDDAHKGLERLMNDAKGAIPNTVRSFEIGTADRETNKITNVTGYDCMITVSPATYEGKIRPLEIRASQGRA